VATRSALTEAAYAAARSKGTYLAAQYARLKGRRGPKKAAMAVGHSILVICYHIVQRSEPYQELGEDYFITGGVRRKPTESVWSVNWSDSVIG
jgi:transposase